MEQSGSRFVRTTAREFAVLAVAAIGAYLFFIHGVLYVQPAGTARPLNLEGFLLVTTILYLLLRLTFVVASLYYPHPAPAYTVCEVCGKVLDETPPLPGAHHAKTGLSHRPTEKEVLAAVMLRKAIDDARRLAKKDLTGPEPEQVRLPGDVENAPVPLEEFQRILRDLDAPRGRNGPEDRRPKGPS